MKRENNLDLLRVVAMFLVILNHSLGLYINNYQYKCIYILVSISGVCNALFLMLTGYFLLDRKYDSSLVFYKKSFKKIFIDVIVFSFFYLIWNNKSFILNAIFNNNNYFDNTINSLINAITGWYGHPL